MPENLTCPQCSRALRVPESLLGKEVKCPTCGATFTAPFSGPPAVHSPPRRAADQPRRRERDDADDYEDAYEDDRPRRRRRRDLEPHRGTMILTFGIIGLVAFAPLGLVAWILGNNDLAAIRAGRMDPEGESSTSTGRILGIIATCLWGVSTCCICSVYAFFFSAVATGTLK